MASAPRIPAAELYDAHCHPQVAGARCVEEVGKVHAGALAVMATRRTDWPLVAQLHDQHPERVIPCFGIHPWVGEPIFLRPARWRRAAALQAKPLHATATGPCSAERGAPLRRHAHLHALGDEALLEGKSEEDVRIAAAALEERGDAALRRDEWEPELRRLLLRYPTAIVGEFGLDRAAVIMDVGVRYVMPGYQHQLALTRHHLQLAAELQRPVSVHCVRCYGHLYDLFREMDVSQCPPRVMMHSYAGSVDTLHALTRLPVIGERFFFSFSHVINAEGKQAPAKLLERVRHVPEQRLLLESDQVVAPLIDRGLQDICQLVAEAKGWTLEHTARLTTDNFHRFYSIE